MAISPAGHVVPSEVVVRRAVAGDAPPARAAIERAIRGSSRDFYSRSQVEAWAAGGTTDGVLSMIETTVAFVAESNGRIVGFSNLDGAEVDQLYVDPELERTGVARQLYDAVEVEAIRRGISALTATASLRAVPAFSRFGFEEVAEVARPFNGETFNVVKMRKVIRPSARAERTDDHPDPLLQHLIKLTREGTVVAAFQAAHDKFRRLHADCLRLAATATTEEDALNELRQTLDAYTALFNEHHHAEDHYFFPALRQAQPALNRVVDQLVAQHEHLATRLTQVVEQARRLRSDERPVDGLERLAEALTGLEVAVDAHLLLEETETVPVLSTWTQWPI